MHIIHTIGGLHPRLGGPVRTVSKLAECLAAEGTFRVSLLSQGLVGEPVFPKFEAKLDRHVALLRSRGLKRSGLPFRKLMIDAVRDSPPLLIHDHGIWTPANHFVAATAQRFQIPLIIHPRGMLEPWALEYRAWKKRLAISLYQRRDLESAALLFATAKQEAESIRRLGLRQPIAVIPNGVEVVVPLSAGSSQSEGKHEGTRTALFLSRVHPKKGLLYLIEAWGQVRPVDWRLCIAGPDEGGHTKEVLQKIRKLGLEASVDYMGEVDGDAKTALFEKADLFVLPSFSENFGVVVTEALAHGLPVITTRGTPWEGILNHGCGWWVEPTAGALIEALREAMYMDPTGLQAMGEKGREYAREFDWAHIAQITAEVYRWVLGQGPIPACVVRD